MHVFHDVGSHPCGDNVGWLGGFFEIVTEYAHAKVLSMFERRETDHGYAKLKMTTLESHPIT